MDRPRKLCSNRGSGEKIAADLSQEAENWAMSKLVSVVSVMRDFLALENKWPRRGKIWGNSINCVIDGEQSGSRVSGMGGHG